MKKSRPTIGIVKSRVFLTGTAFVLMACSSGEEFAGHSGKGEEPVITPVLCTSGASEQAVKVYDFLRENRNKKTQASIRLLLFLTISLWSIPLVRGLIIRKRK